MSLRNQVLARIPLRNLSTVLLLPLLFVISIGQASAAINDTSWIDKDAVAIRLADRPRLFIDDKTVAKILGKAGDPFTKQMIDNLYSTTASMSKSAPLSGFASKTRPGAYGHVLPFLALSYKMSGKTVYFDELKSRLQQLISASTWKEDGDLSGAWILFGMACAYDWLYDDFTPTFRKAMRDKMAWQANIFTNHIINNSIFWVKKYYNNHCHIGSSALAAAGLALYGDHPKALEYLAVSNHQLKNMLAVLPRDGSWHEGVAYWADAFIALMRHSAIDQKAFGTNHLRSQPWFRNVITYRQHISLPGMKEIADFGDTPRSEKYLSSSPGLFRLASEFNDPVAQRLAKNGVFTKFSWLDIVWFNPDLKESAESTWKQRSAYLWDQGFYFWRSAWSSQAVFWGLRAGPPMGHTHFEKFSTISGWAHVHPDVGHVVLHAGGKHLLIDDGYVLRKRTANHNVPLIGGIGQRGERLDSSRWFDGQAFFKVKKTARITKVAESGMFSYVVADLAGSYKTEAGINTLKRYYLFLYDGTGVIVDAYSLNGSKEYRALFHTAPGTISNSNGLVKYKADTNNGFFLRPLSASSVSMSHGSFSIASGEQHQSNNSGMLVNVRQNGSSGKVFMVVEPIRANESAMKWKATLTGGKLKLEKASENVVLIADFGQDVVVTDGSGKLLTAAEVPFGRSTSGTTSPGTTTPVTSDPGTSAPGASDPGTTPPGTSTPTPSDPQPPSSGSGSTPTDPQPPSSGSGSPSPEPAPVSGGGGGGGGCVINAEAGFGLEWLLLGLVLLGTLPRKLRR
jgi:hypothetical protein